MQAEKPKIAKLKSLPDKDKLDKPKLKIKTSHKSLSLEQIQEIEGEDRDLNSPSGHIRISEKPAAISNL